MKKPDGSLQGPLPRRFFAVSKSSGNYPLDAGMLPASISSLLAHHSFPWPCASKEWLAQPLATAAYSQKETQYIARRSYSSYIKGRIFGSKVLFRPCGYSLRNVHPPPLHPVARGSHREVPAGSGFRTRRAGSMQDSGYELRRMAPTWQLVSKGSHFFRCPKTHCVFEVLVH